MNLQESADANEAMSNAIKHQHAVRPVTQEEVTFTDEKSDRSKRLCINEEMKEIIGKWNNNHSNKCEY